MEYSRDHTESRPSHMGDSILDLCPKSKTQDIEFLPSITFAGPKGEIFPVPFPIEKTWYPRALVTIGVPRVGSEEEFRMTGFEKILLTAMLFSLVRIQYLGDCVKLVICQVYR